MMLAEPEYNTLVGPGPALRLGSIGQARPRAFIPYIHSYDCIEMRQMSTIFD